MYLLIRIVAIVIIIVHVKMTSIARIFVKFLDMLKVVVYPILLHHPPANVAVNDVTITSSIFGL